MAEEEPTPQPDDMVSKAEAAARRLEEANKKQEELLAKNEALMTRSILGGRSEVTKQEPKKEITAAEYAQAALRGRILR